jgi:hypothetical protein
MQLRLDAFLDARRRDIRAVAAGADVLRRFEGVARLVA